MNTDRYLIFLLEKISQRNRKKRGGSEKEGKKWKTNFKKEGETIKKWKKKEKEENKWKRGKKTF